MFDLYQDPLWIQRIITFSSILMNFLIWQIAANLAQVPFMYEKRKIIPSWSVMLFALMMTWLNYFGLSVNLYLITPAYVGIAYLSYRFITDKSIRWINISMALLILSFLLTYTFFNQKIHWISFVYFSTNDILEYEFKYKPFFQIYHNGDFLGSVRYVLQGKEVILLNEPMEYRIYLFYTTLCAFALAVWHFIYFDVLNKHSFSLERKLKEINWKDAKEHTKNLGDKNE